MGCICSKTSAVEDSREGLTTKLSSLSKRSSELNVSRLNSSKRDEGVWTKNVLDGRDVKASLVSKKPNGLVKFYNDQIREEKIEKPELTVLNHPGLGKVPNATEGEQVAAGWPAWLSSVAGEAIKGWIPRRANTFERLYKIGQGTYSSVYKARDVTYQKTVALKKVRFDNLDPESVKFMAREIFVLRLLDHPNVIKLEGLITSQTSRSLYLIFEYMEHDLTGLVSHPGIKFSEPQIKCYMQQLLSGLDHCHSRGVLHRDIKGSNLLIDNNGILKIADFGLASFFDPHHSVPLTSRVVTLWYRPPELILGASHYGVAVDLWSTGCILGELYSGRPILPGKTEVEQLHRIFKLCGSPSEDYWLKLRSPHSTVFKPPHHYRRCVAETFQEYPPPSVRLLETLLSIDPAHRGTAATALQSEFFTMEPLACDPSSLPKYPPSKEIDAKLRDEATRRQRAVGVRELKVGMGVRPEKGHRALAANNNADPRMSMQQGRHSSSRSRSELFNPSRESASGLLVFPHKQSDNVKEMENNFSGYRISSHSGPLVQGPAWIKVGKDVDEGHLGSNGVNLSKLSGLVASRTSMSEDQEEKSHLSQPGKRVETRKPVESTSGSELRRRQAQKHQSQRIDLCHGEHGRTPTKELTPEGYGGGNKIYLSGPLMVSSNNMDQMLKEHDRKIQEFSRRARVDKSRGEKVHSK
ncbi:probable serine/threonine-protein kinase At1g54610 [Prosopis cineraria]|uniref:probable serine/threonine-protein kinase At1g54610 n=1 Tax=Prosopis cineraria TaxID=364024 RepID=UPI00240FE96A|nr:probable serine/threonine-protein kinase At1g54610 [Prosopis cineraria]XP_054790429.1 probable serine/threonine-protein kinase At1g54610 [Prosopis cineraria]XP_054790430.1 probable serine/threonine-protein kinase At1g54610 [Prosopis cineraria]